MAEKEAFVFDTNFIIQVQELDAVIENLKDNYNVYVTQVSIDERIAQQCREIKINYDTLEAEKEKFKSIATIQFKKSYEEAAENRSAAMKKKYSRVFGDRIIPFSKDEVTFSTVIDRANKKTPPFLAEKNASDKGFKDCLLWLSLLAYFKDNGEDRVVFLTDDGGFEKNAEELKKEFSAYTGKIIEFKSNAYYKELVRKDGDKLQPVESEKQEPLPDMSLLRKEVDDIFDSIIQVAEEDYYGNITYEKTFTIYEMIDETVSRDFFEALRDKVLSHMLETKVWATEILEVDSIVNKKRIPMDCFEELLKLYENVKKNYPQYMESFINAFVHKINCNYEDNPFANLSGDDLPF